MSQPADEKEMLLHYLREARESLVWKLDGLTEYDARRPLTPTATNLLGLVKHVAATELLYLGHVFGRRLAEPVPWLETALAPGAEPNLDMWATPEETRDDVVGFYRRVWANSDATIGALGLDTPCEIPWWRPGTRATTLRRIVVHMIAETHRHAGHADIVRELIDGAAGLRPDRDNLPPVEREWWASYHARVEEAARRAAGR
ncbi:DinB family protein [Nonomuraea sp. CA-218870]|uniref:DinB family protein n=1 Tax=Nonomuraea sp. CA-218870 TaxID=3239998 RepID=UPI003D8E6F67